MKLLLYLKRNLFGNYLLIMLKIWELQTNVQVILRVYCFSLFLLLDI